ncbi:MAG: glycosyltransferase family 2 protein [Acidobacteria bacterium]|nr:glycosyltransferase family 2 protein [Acidobacteriota bacterium]
MLEQITPLILTRDEDVNIGRTLGQLEWAAEVVVVDSLSTDGTVEIAQSFPNARVVQRPYDTLAAQSNFGIAQADTEWVMLLDADYYVTDELTRQLAALRPPEDVDAYEIPFLYAVNGKRLRATLYPPRIVLFRRKHGGVVQDGHAHRVRVPGRTERLDAPIVHDDRKSLGRFLDRQKRYMRQEAAKLREADPKTLNFAARLRKLRVVAPFAVLVHTLFVKRLFLDGFAGMRYVLERVLAECMLSVELFRKR